MLKKLILSILAGAGILGIVCAANWPTAVSSDSNLYVAKNNCGTSLTANITSAVTTISALDTTCFASVGYITIGEEAILCTGKTATTFTGCTRGADGTTAVSHNNGDEIGAFMVAAHHNVLKDELIAISTSFLQGAQFHTDYTNTRFGIGTASPSGKLSVDFGNIATAGALFRYNSSNQPFVINALNNNGDAYIGWNAAAKSGSDTATYILSRAATKIEGGSDFTLYTATSGTAGGDITWNNRMVIKNDTGYVGINKSAPASMLHVAGAGTFSVPGNSDVLDLASNTSGTVAIRLAASGASSNAARIKGVLNGTDTDLSFLTGGSERVIIDKSGYFGVGTSTPTAKIEGNDGNHATTGWVAGNTGLAGIFSGANSTVGNGGNIRAICTDTMAVDKGGSMVFGGYTTAQTESVDFAMIGGRKENGTTGNYSGYLWFGTRVDGGNQTERMRITSAGYLVMPGVYNQTTASAANVFVDSSGNIMRSTSSKKYKTAIHDLSLADAQKLLKINPIIYKSKAPIDDPAEFHYGFIAEDVDEIDPLLVSYAIDKKTKKKTPDGIQYDRTVVGLLKLVQDLEARVKALEDAAK